MAEFPPSDDFLIREVWNHNLEEEFDTIRSIINEYPYISMDTEFPGAPNRIDYSLNFETPSDQTFHQVKANVDSTKLIQLGLTISDAYGNLPKCGTEKYCLWQFNFRGFDPDKDICVPSSVQFLRGHGIDFERFNREGVDVSRFGKLLRKSGLLKNAMVHWWTFQSRSDFGYLLKILTGNKVLPDSRKEFLENIKKYFPNVYDMKHLMTVKNLHGGLEHLARSLNVPRVGQRHQAGSDSLLTCRTFVSFISKYFNDGSFMNHADVLHGLR